MMLICPRVTHRIPIDPRTIFRQTFYWLGDCFPIIQHCPSQWWSHPHFVDRDCRWPGRGGQWGGMIEIMKQRKGGNAEAESLKRSVSGEKGIGAKMVLPGKPRT